MNKQVLIRIDPASILLLKNTIGKKLTQIAYVYDLSFSAATALLFEDYMLQVVNTSASKDNGDEYPELSFKETHIINDLAFEHEKFEYIECDFTISRIELMSDTIIWNDDGDKCSLEIQNAIILHSDDSNIVLYAIDTIAEATAVYLSKEEFENSFPIQEQWPIDTEDVIYTRTFQEL